jgi:hypothetical protein
MSDDLIKELRSYPRHYEAAHRAAEEIERLRAEVERVREMAAKALKSAGELDRWHKYGEGYGALEEFVATIAKQEKK